MKVAELPIVPFLAHFLFILAAWTLTIKFIFPACYALAQGLSIGTYIYWDFWWVVHIALGYSLLHWNAYTYPFALLTAVVEITIIVVKFGLFAVNPEWTIWRTNWFINKVFVLGCFVLLFIVLIRHRSLLWEYRHDQQESA